MTVKLIGLWPAVFQYAGRLGQARVAFKENPSPENDARLEKAKKDHDEYVAFCLHEADEMRGLDLRGL